LADKENFATMMRNFSIGFESNEVIVNNKIFFIVFCFGLLSQFHPIYSMHKIPSDVVAYDILPFLPFEDDFFKFVVLHYDDKSKNIIVKLFDTFKKNKNAKKIFAKQLVQSCSIRPMNLEIYSDKEKSKKDGFNCVRRSAKWFWKNFEKIREFLNNVLNNTILIFHYRSNNKNHRYFIDKKILEKLSSIKNLRGLDLTNCFNCKFIPTEIISVLIKFKNLRWLGICLKINPYKKEISTDKIETLCKNMKLLDFSLKVDSDYIFSSQDLITIKSKEAFNSLIKSEILQKNLAVLKLDCYIPKIKSIEKKIVIDSEIINNN